MASLQVPDFGNVYGVEQYSYGNTSHVVRRRVIVLRKPRNPGPERARAIRRL